MNINKRILIIGDPAPLLQYAKELGLSIAWVQDADNISSINACKLCEEVYMIDYKNDVEYTINFLSNVHKIKPFDAVWSNSEYGLYPASVLSETLRIPGLKRRSVELTRDKAKMRQLLAENNLSYLPYSICSNTDDAVTFAEKYGYPIILKPTDGTGSRGVIKIDSQNDLRAAMEKIVDECGKHTKMIAEKFVEGIEVSVEAFTLNGKHYLITITDKKNTGAPRFIEYGHTMPSTLDLESQNLIFSMVEQFLDVINYDFGPSHTEIILGEHGPIIVESHTRVGGNFIGYMLEKAMNFNVYSIIYQSLFGNKITDSLQIASKKAATVRNYILPEGIVQEVSHTEMVKAHPNVIWHDLPFHKGQVIGEITSNLHRLGVIVVLANTVEEAETIMDEIVNTIVIKVE